MPEPAPVKASWWEIVGAWLGIWTPPIGAEIPPVPWRWFGVAAVVLLVAGTVIALETGDNRRDNAAAQERAERAAVRARFARAAQEQRLVRARVEPGAPALPGVEAAVLAEARARAETGELATPPREAQCAPYPGEQRPDRLVLDCAVVTSIIPDGEGEAVGQLSVPFRAVLERGSDRVAICALNPPAGEQALPDPRELAGLPRPCRP